MTPITRVVMRGTDASAAIALLLIAEATLFFTFVFVVGPIATLARLLPLVAVLGLCAALYWGQNWARWALLVPIAFRLHRLVLLTAAASGLGRTGTALFLTLIILTELTAAFILLDRYFRSSTLPAPSSQKLASLSS